MLSRAARREAVVQELQSAPVPLLQLIFSAQGCASNFAQLLAALPANLMAIAIQSCAQSDVMAIAIPDAAALNKRAGAALGECLKQLQHLRALEFASSAYSQHQMDFTTPPTLGCKLGFAGLAPHLSCLTALVRFSIVHVHIDVVAAKALAAGLASLRHLRQLQLIACTTADCQAPVAHMLQHAVTCLPDLTDFHLRHSALGAHGSAALGVALQNLNHLVAVDLHDCDLNGNACSHLLHGLRQQSHLRLLDMCGNTQLAVHHLADLGAAVGACTGLIGLNLSAIGATCKDFGSFAAHLAQLTRVRWLRLSHAALRSHGASLLCQHARVLKGIQHLELQSCEFGAAGFAALAPLLPCLPQLVWLDLSHNDCGDEGCAALASVLPMCAGMTELLLNDNAIGDAGVAMLGIVAGLLVSMHELVLDGNAMSVVAVGALARLLPTVCAVRAERLASESEL